MVKKLSPILYFYLLFSILKRYMCSKEKTADDDLLKDIKQYNTRYNIETD